MPLSPSIFNTVRGAGPEFWVDYPENVRNVPMLFVIAEEDQTVTPDRSEPAAAFFNVLPTRVGADWGLMGHGHMLMIENGHLAVAERIAAWLENSGMGAR